MTKTPYHRSARLLILVYLIGLAIACSAIFSCVTPARGFEQDPTATAAAVDTATAKVRNTTSTAMRFRLQFQMMEAESKDYDQVLTWIDSSIAHANRYFKHQIIFERDPYIYYFDSEGKDIYTLYDAFVDKPRYYNRWADERYVDSAITVFVMPTYARERSILLGFCPVLLRDFHYYEDEAPAFDHLFVSYLGLQSNKTLAHELGHWLGLAHTFALTRDEKLGLGITTDSIERLNLMNYVPHPTELTSQQVFAAWRMASTYRAYRLAD